MSILWIGEKPEPLPRGLLNALDRAYRAWRREHGGHPRVAVVEATPRQIIRIEVRAS